MSIMTITSVGLFLFATCFVSGKDIYSQEDIVLMKNNKESFLSKKEKRKEIQQALKRKNDNMHYKAKEELIEKSFKSDAMIESEKEAKNLANVRYKKIK